KNSSEPGARQARIDLRRATAHCARICPFQPPEASMREDPVSYKDGDTTLKGFVVYDDAKQGKRPGILVLHEWWGITKHVMDEARHVAGQGYTAFVADLYGEGKTADN